MSPAPIRWKRGLCYTHIGWPAAEGWWIRAEGTATFAAHAYGTHTPQPASRRLIAELGGLEGIMKEAHGMFVRSLVGKLTDALDHMAGPHGLSPAEREIQELCRDRFGLYDPTSDEQIGFVADLYLVTRGRARPSPPGRTGGEPPEEDPKSAVLRRQRSHPHPVGRHRRADAGQPTSRRPDSRPEWGRYLVKWRTYQD